MERRNDEGICVLSRRFGQDQMQEEEICSTVQRTEQKARSNEHHKYAVKVLKFGKAVGSGGPNTRSFTYPQRKKLQGVKFFCSQTQKHFDNNIVATY
ncbi:hypothetical protein TNCV_179371 [Trichonephila clavipes]|nr:hypothetical protein TNCV_179371 [Trichonephila clavipes]